ncbi:MAG TPA: alanine--glyoxylate aminotransferase family protein [Clostridiales bacterium]|nr:alanine--glyoxylate aminotransferase family protein [Clostridiales bacterium]
MKLQEYFLLPGPTNVPPNVIRAMSKQMINHRGPEFKAILSGVTHKIKKVFQTEGEVFTLTSSGTGGLEAAVVNFINPGDKVIVASIGNFGERFRDIAKMYDAEVDFIDFGWGNCIDPQVIAERLGADTDHQIKAVLCQHNETSTAIVNPIGEISAARGDHPALLIVDSVSGLGAAPFDMDGWKVDVAVTGSQKAFMSPPGLAFVAANQRAMKIAKKNQNRKFYFDLIKAQDMLEKGQTPFTPALSVLFAVEEALRHIEEVGIDAVVADHYKHRNLVRTGLKAMGLKLLAPDEIASPAVTAVACPDGIDPLALRKVLREKYNIIIAGGQGKFAANTFRVGHLGAVQSMDLIAVIAGLELALTELGADITLGKAVAEMEREMLRY